MPRNFQGWRKSGRKSMESLWSGVASCIIGPDSCCISLSLGLWGETGRGGASHRTPRACGNEHAAQALAARVVSKQHVVDVPLELRLGALLARLELCA